jgi:hypothetical protein
LNNLTFSGAGSESASKLKEQNGHIFKGEDSSAPATIFHVEISGEVRSAEEVGMTKRVTEQTERAQHNTRDSPFMGIV